MKLLELFKDKTVFNVTVDDHPEHYSEQTAFDENTKYSVDVYRYTLSKHTADKLKVPEDSIYWEIEFSRIFHNTRDFDITGTGNEYKVFEFVISALKRFVAKHDPTLMVIATKTTQASRNKLYARLFKRFASDYELREVPDESTNSTDYWLIKHAVNEGKMKRSDPYISGELPGPRPIDKPLKPKYDRKILNLASKSHKSPEEVDTLWKDMKGTVDMRHPGAYAIVTAKVQRALGLREALTEAQFKHIENEDGELTYGWKTDLEDEEESGYIPAGYSKKVLELGGIYAAKPGQGQGDRLMKLFLDSPEAKKAELIFLDPVPGLGANFKSTMSDTQQIRRLQAFYRRYGFRNKPGANRMWLVKKGTIPDNKLPT